MTIKEIIEKVESGELDLVMDYDFYEVEYIDAPADVYIQHEVEGVEVGGERVYLLFAETDARKEFRITHDKADEEGKRKLENDYSLNELNDEYDYDKVVGYDIGNGVVLL